MAEGALRNTATRWAWPTSRLSGRVTARRGTSNGSSKAISGRLEHLRASALGSRILTKHIARRLPTSEGQGPTTPLIGMSRESVYGCAVVCDVLVICSVMRPREPLEKMKPRGLASLECRSGGRETVRSKQATEEP